MIKTEEDDQKALRVISSILNPLVHASDVATLRTSCPLGNFPGSASFITVHNTFDIVGGFSLHLDTELIKREPSRIFIRLIQVSIDVTGQILSDPAGSLLMQILGGVRPCLWFLNRNPGETTMLTSSGILPREVSIRKPAVSTAANSETLFPLANAVKNIVFFSKLYNEQELLSYEGLSKRVRTLSNDHFGIIFILGGSSKKNAEFKSLNSIVDISIPKPIFMGLLRDAA